MNSDCYKDRQLILRAFKAAGDEPSAELLALIPETVLSILNDEHASTRDRIRAAECIQTMQKIQLSAIGTVNQVKARRDRKKLTSNELPELIHKPMDEELLEMLTRLELEVSS
jgi:hypothetical protein